MKFLATLILTSAWLCAAANTGAAQEAKFRQILAVAADCIANKEWKLAVESLDVVLKEPNDVELEVIVQKKKVKTTLFEEAERLIKSMPKAGREEYEKIVGPRAADLLQAAEKNEKKLLVLTTRCLYTNAGADGAVRLAGLQYDGGRSKEAASTYVRLLDARPLDKLTPPALFRAARACRDTENAKYLEAFWFELRRQAPQGFRDGDRFITHEESERELQNPPEKK